jgi:hypothetical protein
LLVNYIGHAGISRLAREGLLTTTNMPNLGNGSKLPVFMAMTCAAGRFAIPGSDRSLGEALLLHHGGGAVAIWAPSGISLNSQAAMAGGTPFDVSVYNLLGDPATKLK